MSLPSSLFGAPRFRIRIRGRGKGLLHMLNGSMWPLLLAYGLGRHGRLPHGSDLRFARKSAPFSSGCVVCVWPAVSYRIPSPCLCLLSRLPSGNFKLFTLPTSPRTCLGPGYDLSSSKLFDSDYAALDADVGEHMSYASRYRARRLHRSGHSSNPNLEKALNQDSDAGA